MLDLKIYNKLCQDFYVQQAYTMFRKWWIILFDSFTSRYWDRRLFPLARWEDRLRVEIACLNFITSGVARGHTQVLFFQITCCFYGSVWNASLMFFVADHQYTVFRVFFLVFSFYTKMGMPYIYIYIYLYVIVTVMIKHSYETFQFCSLPKSLKPFQKWDTMQVIN